MATSLARNNPAVLGALEKNIFEHIAFMAQEQIEVEFMQELQQLQQLQMAVQQNPMLQQDPNTQQQILTLTLALEARKSKLIADMTQEFKEEENQIMGQLGNDPIAKLKARELDLRAMNDERKAEDAEARLNLDKMKAMMAQENQEDKLDQNEELAKLRANTSIEKTILSKTIPSAPKMDKPADGVTIIRGKKVKIMWFSAIKLAISAGSKIYANKQKTKMAMSEAQLLHADRMARGEEQYQGKLLEARQSDWKDEAVLIILSLPVAILAWAVVSDDPTAMDKVKLFFEMFSQLPSWFTNLWILVVASIYGIKGTQIFRNGGKK